MFTVIKTLEIAGAHQLVLQDDSPCKRLHGHNWIVAVEVSSEELNDEGMVIDFTHIGQVVKRLDHQMLSELKCPSCEHILAKGALWKNPTAENIAEWVAGEVDTILKGLYRVRKAHHSAKVTKVTIQESEGNVACYIP